MNTKVGKTWTAIDNSLKTSAAGGFVKGVGGYGLRVPSSLAEPLRLRDGDRFLELRLQGSSATAKVSGSTATFAGVGKGADLKLTAFNDAVKEDLILAAADAQNSFTYEVNLSAGLELVIRKDGGADIVDAEGEVAFAIPAPIAQDAEGAIAAEGDAKLTYDDGKLTVALSKAWLGEAGRAFPVVLDPSASIGSTRDTFADEITPTTGYASGGDLYAGREAAGHDHNALTYFNVSAHVSPGVFVQEAELNLWPKYQTATTGTKNLQAQRITQSWDAAATWIKRDATNSWSTAGGALDSAILDTQAAGVGEWKRFNLTETVTDWVNDGTTNHGVAITDGASTVDRAIAFASSEWTDSNARPYLEITAFDRAGALPNYTIDQSAITDRSSLGVNVAGGNLLLSSNDLSVAGKGLPLSVQRFYNSSDPWNGQFGNGGGRISLGNDIVLYECDGVGSRCLIGPSGYRARFKRVTGSAVYTTPSGVGNVTLRRATATSGEFTLTDNASGTKWNFFDNAFSFNNRITDRHGNQISFAATGPYGSLSKITDTQQREFPVTANADGYITKIEIPTSILPGGASWQYGYNAYNFLTSVTDPENKVTEYRYGTNDKIDRIKDPRGNFTYILYDTAGRVTSVRREIDGTTANDVTTSYAYYAANSGLCAGVAGNVGRTVVTDPRTKIITYCWNRDGAVVKAFDDDNRPTSTTYTAGGNVSKFEEFAGSTSSFLSSTATTYDAGGTDGRIGKITAPGGEKSALTYGTSSDPVRRTMPDSVTDAHGNKTRYQYDAASFNVTSITNQPDGGTATLGATFAWKTGGTGDAALLESVTDKAGLKTIYHYDAKGNLIRVQPHNSTIVGETEYTYDGLSRVTSMKDGRAGQWVNYTYDKLGRQLSSPDSDGQYTTLTYDNNGNVATRTAPGQSSSYTWDKLNRKTSESLHGASSSYGYDKAGNLTSLTDASGLVTYGYDDLNRVSALTSFGVSTADTTSFQYNDPGTSGATATTGNVIQTLPGGGKIKTTNDLSGKTTEVLVTNNAATPAQTLKRTYQYASSNWDASDAASEPSDLLASVAEQNGGTAATTTGKGYSYTTAGQIAQVITTSGGSTTNTTTYTYDDSGNRKTRVKTPSSGTATTTTYAYNQANQLCWQVDVATSALCPSTSSAPSTGVPSGATTYSYDKAGNQITGGFTGSYDAKGRISGYNGIYSKILSPTNNEIVGLGAGNTFTNTILGLQRIEMGYNLSKLIRNPDSGAVVAQVRDSAKSWLVQDHLGSTIALANTNGGIDRNYTYDIDGNGSSTGTGPETWIKYAGGHDIGGGLYHYGARFYQPSSARWTQQDPLEQPGDLRQHNRYGYAAGNPINYTDPTGQWVPLALAGARVAGGWALKYGARALVGGARGAAAGGRWARKNPVGAGGVGACAWGIDNIRRKGGDWETYGITAAGCATAGGSAAGLK